MSAIAERGDGAPTAPEFEGEIREFVRRDVSIRRKLRPEAAQDGAAAADHMNAVIQRVAGASFDEIDRLITELNGIKATLRREGERIQRDIMGYAALSQSAATSMKVIAESLEQWRPERINARPAPNDEAQATQQEHEPTPDPA
jgi:hypothetical protein